MLLVLTGITLGVGTVLALQVLAARRGPRWSGLVLPGLWVVAIGILLTTGRIEGGRSLVVSVAGLALLLWIWSSARPASRVGAATPSGTSATAGRAGSTG